VLSGGEEHQIGSMQSEELVGVKISSHQHDDEKCNCNMIRRRVFKKKLQMRVM
jgi:hypothetical protein